MGLSLNIKNKKFGKLMAIKKVSKDKHGTLEWLFQCDCGKKSVHKATLVKNGKIRSCGCLRKSKNPQLSGVKHLYNDYKFNAKKRNIGFRLTYEQFEKIVVSNCDYCNAPPTERKRKWIIKVNGVDRVNNTKGYTSNNCVACCIVCNRAKNTMAHKEFKEWIRRIIRYNK